MKKKLLSLFLFFLVFTLVQVIYVPNVIGSSKSVSYRGSNYSTVTYPNGTVVWRSEPQNVWNGKEWVNYIYRRDDSKKCYVVQTGLIAGEIYDSGITVYYDVNLTEQRVKSEVWELWDAVANKKATLNTPITFSIVKNGSGVYINAERTTSKPSGTLSILYAFRAGGSLKHYIKWVSKESAKYTVAIKQVWDLASFITTCNVDSTSKTLATVAKTSGTYNGTQFLFYNATKPFLLFEDQSAMFSKLQPTSLDFSGKKASFTFSNWVLGNGETLVIDPITQTDHPVTGDEINNYGDNYTTVHDATTGAHYGELPDTAWVGQVLDEGSYGVYRDVFEFDTDYFPDSAEIVSAKVMLYGHLDFSDADFYIRIQNWTEPPCNWTDYDAFDGVNYDDGLFNTVSWNISGWNNITLTNFAIIDKQGYTDIMVRSSSDVDSDAPVGWEIVEFYGYLEYAKEPRLEVTYTTVPPTIGTFEASSSTVYANEYFFLSCTVADDDDKNDIVNATVEISNNIILKYDNASDTFSEYLDTSGYCSLDASNSIRTEVDSTSYQLSWKIKLSYSCPEGYKSVIVTNTKVYDSAGLSGTGSHSNLFYFDKKYDLNLRILDNDGDVFLACTVYMDNGTEYSESPSASGWANWTDITASSVSVSVKFLNVFVNSTTIMMDDNKTIDIACEAYPFSIYHVASNASIASTSWSATTSKLVIAFSASTNTYILDTDAPTPTYVLNCSYDIDSDYTTFLELTHYGNQTITLAYPGWSGTQIHRTDHTITNVYWASEDEKLYVLLNGATSQTGTLEIYCGSRGIPQTTSGLTGPIYNSATNMLEGTYVLSSDVTVVVDWTVSGGSTSGGSTSGSNVFVSAKAVDVGLVQQGTSKSFEGSLSWSGSLTLTITNVKFTGDGGEWLQTSLAMPYDVKQVDVQGVVQIPLRLSVPSDAKLGSYTVDVEYVFQVGFETYSTKSSVSFSVSATPVSPFGIPSIMTLFLLFGLLGVVAFGFKKYK
jgi:hypothetical protein